MEAVGPRLLLFDRRSETERQKQLAQKKDAALHDERRLLCARCQHPITRQSERIVVQGNHEHIFTNPSGITFHIGCFREAPGCAASGSGTLEYTWFAGYRWRIATCAQCGTQLGWQFSSSADSFFGLIVNRLT
jgi:hypothetical protein